MAESKISRPDSIPHEDEEPYVVSFSLDDSPEEIQQFFDKYGFVVFRNVMKEKHCRSYLNNIFNFMEAECNFRRNDPRTWDCWPSQGRAKFGFIAGQASWSGVNVMDLRINERLFRAFSLVYQTDQLLTTLDHPCLIMRPSEKSIGPVNVHVPLGLTDGFSGGVIMAHSKKIKYCNSPSRDDLAQPRRTLKTGEYVFFQTTQGGFGLCEDGLWLPLESKNGAPLFQIICTTPGRVDWKVPKNIHVDVNPWIYFQTPGAPKHPEMDYDTIMADSSWPKENTHVYASDGMRVQGFLNFIDNRCPYFGVDDGGFICVPGSHKK